MAMAKQVFINLPVSDLEASKAFYEKLGFTNNPAFTDERGAAMMWSDEIIVMLLTHEFYQRFIGNKTVADTKTQSAALLALLMESREAVQQFADVAKANGGDYYKVDLGVPEDQMFGLEVSDPDGNHWEPMWMNVG